MDYSKDERDPVFFPPLAGLAPFKYASSSDDLKF